MQQEVAVIGMGMPSMGSPLPPAPLDAGFSGPAGLPQDPAGPPQGFDPSMMGPPPPPPGGDLASMIAQALEHAQGVVAGLQQAQDATMHPIVQSMMQGGMDPSMGAMPQDPSMGY